MEAKAMDNKAPDGGPETDMNDQIAVGSYQTKSFEMSNPAQKLYSNLPKDTDALSAEQAAIHLDRLFDIVKDVTVKNAASAADVNMANEYADKVRGLGAKMNLGDEHEAILQSALTKIADKAESPAPKMISPDEVVHPADDPRFNTASKDFATDKASDRDVDNVKNFLIKRNIAAQRKLKIIDNA